jgi:tetratricopeptide (TPR) repeat protein
MRFRLYILFAAVALMIAAGCERSDNSPFTAEIDEAGYRRGKELIKQGRNQEALSEFQKVIETRGLNNAPESHLEVGLLYQQHIKDPLAAIYHYRKYRELKPNSPQSELVRQRIDAATRDFARTLPNNPMENQLERLDMSDVVQRLQRENDQLKADLAAARAGRLRAESSAATSADEAASAPRSNYATNQEASPVISPVVAEVPPDTVPATVPRRPAAPAVAPARPAVGSTAATPARPTAAGNVRRYKIAKGDTLFSLAQKYYGNRSRWRDIYTANRDVMKSEGDLRIGMEIKIPQ